MEFSLVFWPCARSGAYLLDCKASGRFLELEEDNVRRVRYQWSMAAKQVHRPLHDGIREDEQPRDAQRQRQGPERFPWDKH